MAGSDQLDNMAWHALGGRQARFAEWSDDRRAVRFHRDVSPFCAVEGSSGEDWAALAALAEGRAVVLARAGGIETPSGWEQLFGESLTQYVAVDPPPEPDLDVVVLGADDVADMIALTTLTEPGPFLERTIELGHYIGVRDGATLLAMAGERLRTDGHSEISAVCVHPDARRRGLGAALTTKLVHEIRSRGQEAMLHVREHNHAGHALYLSIGFEVRTFVTVGAWRPHRP
jgi:ribosomal protein S18 acetylase RimI-like enzyme